MKSLVIALCLALVGGLAQADEYVNEGKYIYRYTPYSQIKSQNPMIKETAALAHVALVATLESLQRHAIIPEKVMSKKDLDELRARRQDVDDLVDYLNTYITEERGRATFRFLEDKTNVLPDAILIFGGRKASIAVGRGISGSVSIGLVLMPTWEQKIEVATGKIVDEGLTVRSALVGWPSGDVGFGIGGGSRTRFGVGFIWDLNGSFVNPDQFWGAGVGASFSPPELGVGVNLKGGLLSNWEMPGWVDFAYITAAMEMGLMGQIGTPHVNVTTIISGNQFMSMFEKSQQKVFEQAIREVNRNLDAKLKEYRQPLTGQKDKDSKDDEDDASDEGDSKKGGQRGRPVIPKERE